MKPKLTDAIKTDFAEACDAFGRWKKHQPTVVRGVRPKDPAKLARVLGVKLDRRSRRRFGCK